MISDQTYKDLCMLAVQRVEDALDSVTQLINDNEQVAHLSIVVLSTLLRAAAEHIVETARGQNGRKINQSEALAHVLTTMAQANGIGSRALSEEEAIKMGLEKRHEEKG